MRQSYWIAATALLSVAILAIGPEKATAQDKPAEVKVGFNSAIDQISVPVGLEEGFYDKVGLDVTLAPAFASGVDALNALQAGNVQFVHVGAPLQGAMIAGMDAVYIGGYTGTATRVRSDDTFSIVARKGSGIDPKDLNTFKGKKIASTLGSTNQIYIRNMLAGKGIKPEEYTLVNTSPPDMPVALQSGGVDAVVCWDPWPIISRINAAGAYEVSRGGNFVANVGYIVAMREFVEKNPDIVERFLKARAQSDQWVRKNPDKAAEIATRWIPGTDVNVAKEAMPFVGKLMDGRVSACTVRGMQEGMDFTRSMRNMTQPVDVRKHVRAAAYNRVVEKNPELFSDLRQIPAAAKIPGDDLSNWDMTVADAACEK